MSRLRAAILAVMVLAVACSSGGLSLSEYAAEVEELVATMNARLDEFDDELDSNPTLELIRRAASDRVEARQAFVDGMNDLDPPPAAADLHESALDIMTRLTEAEAALAELTNDLESVDDAPGLWFTPEGEAARAVDQEALILCAAAQETFDATASREEAGDIPWIPPEMTEVIEVAFRCDRSER